MAQAIRASNWHPPLPDDGIDMWKGGGAMWHRSVETSFERPEEQIR